MRVSIVIACIVSLVIGVWAPTQVAAETVAPERAVSDFDNEQYLPAVAYNQDRDEYLVVWHNLWIFVEFGDAARDIWAQRVDRYGKPLAAAFLVTPDDEFDRAQPAVAYDFERQRYLVVYTKDVNGEENGTADDWDVHGRFLDPDGINPAYTEFPISGATDNEFYPKLAYSFVSDLFLVTWGRDSASGFDMVRGAYVNAESMNAGIVSTIASSGSANRVNPDITWDPWTDKFLIVYDDGLDVFGKLVPGNVFIPGTEFGIAGWLSQEIAPVVSTCWEYQFLVAWQSLQPDGQYDIYIRFVNADGSIDLDDGPFVVAATTANESQPDVSCINGDIEYLVVWNQQYSSTSGPYGVSGRVVNTLKAMRPQFAVRGVTVGETGVTGQPAAAGGKVGWFAVWEHDRQGTTYQDVHGRSVWKLFADGFEDGIGTWSSTVP